MNHIALRKLLTILFLFLSLPTTALAAEGGTGLDLTSTWFGIAAIIVFVLAYTLVVGEEFLHLRKSKPVIVAAGIIWVLVGLAYAGHGDTHTAANAIRHNLRIDFEDVRGRPDARAYPLALVSVHHYPITHRLSPLL